MMGGGMAVTASQLGSAAKENLPPKMEKRTVSVSTLFDQQDRLKKQNADAARNVFAPRPAGISKPRAASDDFFKKFAKPKSKPHPVYTEFKEVIGEYREGVYENRADGLQPVYEELIARVDGLDVRGRPLDTPGVITQVEINSLISADLSISKLLEDDILNVRNRNTGEEEEVRLGDTLRAFEITSIRKRHELSELLKQLKAVDAEFEAAQEDAIRSEEVEVAKANKELAVKLDALKEEAGRMKKMTEDECKAAYREDKKVKKDWERKIAMLNE